MKKILTIALVALVAFVVVLLGFKYNSDKIELERLAANSQQMTVLLAQRGEIKKEMDAAWAEYDSIVGSNDPCFVLFFDQITDNLMTDAYPLLSEYNLKGTVVMSNLQVPGFEGCITMDDYESLLSYGWDFALGTGELTLSYGNGDEELRAYIEEYKTVLEENGIQMPTTFCFSKDQYTSGYDDILLEYGFKVIRHYGETGEEYSSTIKRNGLYYLGTGTICTAQSVMKTKMSNAYEAGLTYGATVRYITEESDNTRIDCDASKYLQMLQYVERYCPDANVLTATELYEHKQTALSQHSDYLAQFNASIDALEKRYNEIDNQIKALTQ